MSARTSSNNKITLTRGDTLYAQVTPLLEDGTTYEPQEGDTVRFALKHPKMNKSETEYIDEEPVLVKSIPIDTMILKIEPGDTKELGFGDYVYDVELTYANGDVDTFIATADFTLTPEVY